MVRTMLRILVAKPYEKHALGHVVSNERSLPGLPKANAIRPISSDADLLSSQAHDTPKLMKNRDV